MYIVYTHLFVYSPIDKVIESVTARTDMYIVYTHLFVYSPIDKVIEWVTARTEMYIVYTHLFVYSPIDKVIESSQPGLRCTFFIHIYLPVI